MSPAYCAAPDCRKPVRQNGHRCGRHRIRKRTKAECVALKEFRLESDFLQFLLPVGFSSVEDSDRYGERVMPPCPMRYEGIQCSVPYLGSATFNDVTAFNLGEYITATSVLDDIVAVGSQPYSVLLRANSTTGPGPNAVHIISREGKARIYSLCHDGNGVRQLKFVKNSRINGRLGLLCVLATTGAFDVYALPNDITDGSFLRISPVWSASVGRTTIDGAPKGLLSCNPFVSGGRLWILGGRKSGMISVWNIDDNADLADEAEGTFGHPTRTFPITACCWMESTDATATKPMLFCTGDFYGLVCIWDQQQTVPLHQLLVPGTGHVYIRELHWGGLDVSSIYIQSRSLAVWDLKENSLHDVRAKLAGCGEECTGAFDVDFNDTIVSGSISVWTTGMAYRGRGGNFWDDRQSLQTWGFVGRVPATPSRPKSPPAAPAKQDEKQRLYQEFLQTQRLATGLKESNLQYLAELRFWEDEDAVDQFVDVYGANTAELPDPVPLTAVAIAHTNQKTLVVGSAAGLLLMAPLQEPGEDDLRPGGRRAHRLRRQRAHAKKKVSISGNANQRLSTPVETVGDTSTDAILLGTHANCRIPKGGECENQGGQNPIKKLLGSRASSQPKSSAMYREKAKKMSALNLKKRARQPKKRARQPRVKKEAKSPKRARQPRAKKGLASPKRARQPRIKKEQESPKRARKLRAKQVDTGKVRKPMRRKQRATGSKDVAEAETSGEERKTVGTKRPRSTKNSMKRSRAASAARKTAPAKRPRASTRKSTSTSSAVVKTVRKARRKKA